MVVAKLQAVDLLVHIDETHALKPLEAWSSIEEPAETYPSGL